MTTKNNGPLYCGVTNDLVKRTWQHQEGFADGFTKQYNLKKLVWYEAHEDVLAAITREKRIKNWNRIWKINLIAQMNPTWRDLSEDIV